MKIIKRTIRPRQFTLAGLIGLFALSLATPALAASERLENSLTSGGLNIAPRYLDHPGDADMNLLGGYISYPNTGARLVGGQLSLQARLTDNLELLANMGPLAEIGLRGPINTWNNFRLGWDAHFRQDIYFNQTSGWGLSSNLLGIPMMGPTSKGVEAKLNAMYSWQNFNLFLSPLVGSMTNRSYLGADAGLDWSWDRLGLGYAISYHANVLNPDNASAITANEVLHGLGVRYSLNDRFYLQGNYMYTPKDVYGQPTQQILLGGGVRFLKLHNPENVIKPASTSTPVVTPVPLPTPTHSPVVTPKPIAKSSVSTPSISLQGRFYHSGQKALTKRVTVYLKVRRGTKFVPISTTTTTDSKGHYRFLNLPAGEYQVVYRNDVALANTAGVIVSDVVKVQKGTLPTVDLDLAWKDSIPKDCAYQILIERNGKHILGYNHAPLVKGKFTFKLPQWLAKDSHKMHYRVKYWKKAGSFNGANFYSQSRLRNLPK